jgi:small conductance mechanosensitive channel
MTVRVRLKTRPLMQWDVARELRRQIKKVFDEQGIQLAGAPVTMTLAPHPPASATATPAPTPEPTDGSAPSPSA